MFIQKGIQTALHTVLPKWHAEWDLSKLCPINAISHRWTPIKLQNLSGIIRANRMHLVTAKSLNTDVNDTLQFGILKKHVFIFPWWNIDVAKIENVHKCRWICFVCKKIKYTFTWHDTSYLCMLIYHRADVWLCVIAQAAGWHKAGNSLYAWTSSPSWDTQRCSHRGLAVNMR